MNEKRTRKSLRQLELICGHLWHRYSVMVNFRSDDFNWTAANPCFSIFLVRVIYKGNPDRNHKLENIVLKEVFIQITYENIILNINVLIFIEWFYKLNLQCDNIDIHCIVDRRLERKYVSLNSVYKHEQYGRKYYFYILTILYISSISLVVNR